MYSAVHILVCVTGGGGGGQKANNENCAGSKFKEKPYVTKNAVGEAVNRFIQCTYAYICVYMYIHTHMYIHIQIVRVSVK